MRLLEFLSEISGYEHDDVADDMARGHAARNLRAVNPAKLKTWFEHGAYTIKIDRKLSRGDVSRVFFYDENEEMVGNATLHMGPSGFVRMAHIWIEPEYRSQGIAMAVYKHVLDSGHEMVSDADQSKYSKKLWWYLAQEYGMSAGYNKPDLPVNSREDFEDAYKDPAVRLFLYLGESAPAWKARFARLDETTAYPATMTSAQIMDYIRSINREPADFELEAGAGPKSLNAHMKKTIGMVKQFALTEVPVSDYDTEMYADQDLVDQYYEMMTSGQTDYPPIVVNDKGQIIDGAHRLAALEYAGVDTVRAYKPVSGVNEIKGYVTEVRAGTPSKEAEQQITQAIQASPRTELKAGTLVYHGTDADEGQVMFRRPEDYDGGWPFWTTLDKYIAGYYADLQRSGDIGEAQIITFRVTRPITLTLLSDEMLKELPELMGTINIQTLGKVVCELGFSGWVNRGEFNEVMICNPGEFLEFVNHEFVESLNESILDALPPGARKLATGLALLAAMSGAHGHESEFKHPPRHPSVTLHRDYAERLSAMADIIGAENPNRYGQWISNLYTVYKNNPESFKRLFGVEYEKFLTQARMLTPSEMAQYMKDVAQSYGGGAIKERAKV